MKGYFFRLAQQTGLRFKPNTSAAHGGAIEPRAESSTRVRSAQKPLHREETVFVSDSQTQDSPHASIQATDLHAPTTLEKHAAETGSRAGDSKHQAAKIFSAQESNQMGAEAFEDEGARVKSSAPFDASLSAGRIQIQDTRAFIEQGASANETSARLEHAEMLFQPATDSSGASEADGASSLDADAAHAAPEMREPLVAQEPEHFKETASLLESGVKDKELLQKIFLKEIHEWVAAPAASVVDAEQGTQPLALDEKLQRVALIEPDAHPSFQLSRAQTKERERLEQHDLSLSIGSISIVIEEPQQSQQPLAAPPQTQTRAESSTRGSREFSRLSRHYIR
jgi:hypothetical protein